MVILPKPKVMDFEWRKHFAFTPVDALRDDGWARVWLQAYWRRQVAERVSEISIDGGATVLGYSYYWTAD